MFKYAFYGLLCGLGIIAFVAAGWYFGLRPVVDAMTATAGERLVEGVEEAGASAWQLGKAFRELAPAAAPGAALPVALTGGVGGESGDGAAAGEGLAVSPAVGLDGEMAPTVAPTAAVVPPTLPPYVTDAEHEVARAMALLARMRRVPTAETDFVQAVERLAAAWEPRYAAANRDYKTFMQNLDEAEKLAQGYFRTQGELTGEIRDPELRRQAMASDARERELWVGWREQAGRLRSQAQAIKRDVDDMNLLIAKLQLSASFSGLQRLYVGLPPSLLQLEKDLVGFERERQRIVAAFQ